MGWRFSFDHWHICFWVTAIWARHEIIKNHDTRPSYRNSHLGVTVYHKLKKLLHIDNKYLIMHHLKSIYLIQVLHAGFAKKFPLHLNKRVTHLTALCQTVLIWILWLIVFLSYHFLTCACSRRYYHMLICHCYELCHILLIRSCRTGIRRKSEYSNRILYIFIDSAEIMYFFFFSGDVVLIFTYVVVIRVFSDTENGSISRTWSMCSFNAEFHLVWYLRNFTKVIYKSCAINSRRGF